MKGKLSQTDMKNVHLILVILLKTQPRTRWISIRAIKRICRYNNMDKFDQSGGVGKNARHAKTQ